MDWTHRLRLRNLQMLISLAETRNVSRSAELLHTTQPGLSKWLKEIETDIGLPLFERHARGLRPTAYGEALLRHARRVEAELDRGRDEMTALRQGASGLVMIGASGAAAPDAAPMAVLALLQAMPQVRVRLVENTMDELIRQLQRGELDLVVGRSAPEHNQAMLESEDLHDEQVHFVARAGHPLHRRRQLGWADLRRYRWILWPNGTPIRAIFDAALAHAGEIAPDDHLQLNSMTANLALLAGSDMLSIVSDRAAARYEQLKILRRLPLRLHAHGTVAMYWRSDVLRSAAVDEAIACLRSVAGARA
ncbi:LysR substrate-binding domain-containing protein [Ramlibacter sp.]|uniref:LysR substrate-binding domain-containing protein n=1 Tax=Ramlibacter sp. TaxID=1917967 RepID=UPI0026092A23|nr:LysR substrate-binding domain-containing protein [Ramlibacter sp.]MDB5955233.1 LysR family transcriptional regulator [Ramlibacter sp.]